MASSEHAQVLARYAGDHDCSRVRSQVRGVMPDAEIMRLKLPELSTLFIDGLINLRPRTTSGKRPLFCAYLR
jgi:hypothetical protein